MKLLSLTVNRYKNLQIIPFDFTNTSNYVALVGLNGSGKSNIIEVISKIFGKLHKSSALRPLGFNYTIRYAINNLEVEVSDGKMTIIKENGNIVNRRIVAANRENYLPSEIIACYSGDELRLWGEAYFKFYKSYIQEILNGSTGEKHRLIYLNKYAWEIALISLLCHENSEESLKTLLNVNSLSDIKIEFIFPQNYDKLKDSYIKILETGVPAQNDALDLLHIIKTTQESSATKVITCDDIKDIVTIANSDNTKKCRKLFHLLYSVGSDKEKKLFSRIQIKLNGFTLKELSEGEKKIILVKCISDILANKNSLILLDEPDSHVHVARKKEIKEIIDKTDYYTLFTTHSPSLCQFIPVENLMILQNGDYVNPQNAIKAARVLVDDDAVLKLLFSTKDILIVEGKTDDKYINKAIEHFKIDYTNLDFDFLRVGGTDGDNIISLLSKIAIGNSIRKIIVLVDRDQGGINVYKKLFPATANKEKQAISIEKLSTYKNTYFLMIPHKITANQGGDFLIEDYFSKQKMRDLTKQLIDNNFDDTKPFKDFPKVKERLKEELLPDFCQTSTAGDMVSFKILLDKLQIVVNYPNE